MATSSTTADTRSLNTTPLLGHTSGDHITRSRRLVRRRRSLRTAARFLHRTAAATSGHTTMRDSSVRVRVSAAEQLEERQSEWAYSKPIVVIDLCWNFVLVTASFTALGLSLNESPFMPLRLWIVGYVLQCVLHMACVCVEYRRRREERNSIVLGHAESWSNSNSSFSSDEGNLVEDNSERYQDDDDDDYRTSVAKHLESANTMFSFIWWIIGFYWMSTGDETLERDAPRLYWLCITFLAFDVIFVVLCVAVACLIGVAVCICLPCIITVLYALTDQEGASKEDIERLPTYTFRKLGDIEKLNGESQESFGGIMTECDTDTPVAHVLPLEDAECCICISAYDDYSELRELPCRHHFHSACIDKWLYINATCPLCKFNILNNGHPSGNETA